GTLIRVYATFNGAKLAEFRRGIDTATIYSIAFNTNNSLLAVTSDKATLHVFDLPTPQNLQLRQALVAAHRQASQPRQPNYSRSSRATLGQLQNHGSSPEHTSSSSLSSSRANVTGTFSHRYTNKWGMLQRVPLLPRFFSDTYSFASAPFDVGDELLPSDGGPSDGTANRQALTTDWLSDRPTRGAIGWVSESELVIASAGVSTKWEKFTIAQDANGCRYCVRTGWTRYLKG
ncbi:Phosphatidylinositol 3,5-bisphosphate-binding protein, partial [Ascosphaera acerosa]